MTTIATDGRSMAGDGLLVLNDYVVNEAVQKIERTASGRIVGCCGDSGDDHLFIDWLEGSGPKPKLGKNFGSIVLACGEPVRVYFCDCTYQDVEPPYAIGSGAKFAFAAMDAGKSPAEAVQIASGRCVYTGGTITVLSLEQEVANAA